MSWWPHFTILLTCTPINLPIEPLFTHVCFCNQLWESFWISSHLWSSVWIYFLSLYENKQAHKFHHLKQIFYHQKQIMIFCWFCMFPFYVFLPWISSHFMSDYFLVKQSVLEFIKLSCDIHSFCCIRFFTIYIFHGMHLWQTHRLFLLQTGPSF